MLDMGFWPDVQRILSKLPAKRQTLLFSATMYGEVLRLTKEFLHDPKSVQVGRRGGPAQTISHGIQEVAKAEKAAWLARWLRDDAEGPVLIFCRTKIGADRLASSLSRMGIRSAALHADRTQQQRMSAVEGFRTGAYPVLVATDVAARGLDIDGIAHVVNFEVPDTPEAYVHRVGRTGRAESTGKRADARGSRRSARTSRAGESRWRPTSITTRPRYPPIRRPLRPRLRPPQRARTRRPLTTRRRQRWCVSAPAGGCNPRKRATPSSARTGKSSRTPAAAASMPRPGVLTASTTNFVAYRRNAHRTTTGTKNPGANPKTPSPGRPTPLSGRAAGRRRQWTRASRDCPFFSSVTAR